MLLLRATADVFRINVSQAADLECKVDAVEVDNATPPVVQDLVRNNIASITGTGTTTLLDCTTANRRRNVKACSIFNNHASSSGIFMLEHTDGTNVEVLKACTLLPKESFDLLETGEWVHYDSDGNRKPSSAKLDAYRRVESDVTNATTSFADVTGLTVPLQSGKKYGWEAHLYHVNNASTTGSRFGYNIGAAPTVEIAGTIDTVTPSVTASAHSAGVVAARDTAVTAQTTGSTSQRLAILSGYIQPSADGTFAIRCASEVAVASGLIVKAGSWLHIWEHGN